jgi:lipoprotein-releasing system ATP-binding protein
VNTTSNNGPLIEVKGLTKVFDHGGRRLEVLKGIELLIRPGEMLAVVGKSGAGKSTLLHILGTLDRPSSGRVLFDGKDLFRQKSAQLAQFRNRHIGFVFQFHHLLPEFTALENVMMPVLIHRVSRPKARAAALAMLESVGLSGRLTHRPGELSGGEQQRVALARALVMEPKLLLADEPTGNLDSHTSAGIHELFGVLNERCGTAMLIVTHNADLAERMPRTVRMEDGRIGDRALETMPVPPAKAEIRLAQETEA